MNKNTLCVLKMTALEIAERAFQEAITHSYPSDLIKRLYDDLRVARDNADTKRR